MLEFPIHVRDPPVQQLTVHLENGQHVYFSEDTALVQASGDPPKTTLTNFFVLCTYVRRMTLPGLIYGCLQVLYKHAITSPGTEENKEQMLLAFGYVCSR